jgi:hypothetical protein
MCLCEMYTVITEYTIHEYPILCVLYVNTYCAHSTYTCKAYCVYSTVTYITLFAGTRMLFVLFTLLLSSVCPQRRPKRPPDM